MCGCAARAATSQEADMSSKAKLEDKKPAKPDKKQLDRELDEGLEETFPTSDPVAVTETMPNHKGEREKK